MTTTEPKKKFTEAERDVIIRQTMLHQLQKIDRVMTGFPILKVDGVNDPKAPAAYTSGVDIAINWAWVGAIKTDEDLASLYGLNYHELAHVILTPRLRGSFYKAMQGINLELCFNLMEDWRIETHFATMFSSANRYFNIMVRRLLLDDHQLRQRKPEDEWTNFPMTMGRFYLDPAIRLRYERLARQKLKGRSRRMEILESYNPKLIDEITEHFRRVEENYQMPGLQAEYLKLLDLEGDVRIDKMLEIAREFCGRRWSTVDEKHNRAGILLVKKMVLLMPFELQESAPGAGVPVAGNYDNGGKYGVDMPVHQMPSELEDEDLQDAASEIATEAIEEDKERYEQLRKRAQQHDPDLEEDGEDEGEGDDSDEEEEPELEEDEDDSEGEDAGQGKAAGVPEPPPQIIIDPTQSNDPDNEATSEKDDEDEELLHADGHLTGGAGGGEYDGQKKADHLAQLSSDELAELDKVFREAGVFDQFLTDEIEKILVDQSTQRDIRTAREVIAEALGENLDLDATLDVEFKQVPPRILMERDRLKDQLLEIQSLLEGTWRDDQPQGKINLRRWLNAPVSQRSSLFRSWVKDEIDEAGLEMVILLDRSSSMGSAMDHASQICWMVASACQAVDARVHVISFSDPGREEVLLSPSKDVRSGEYQFFGSYGGTAAADALKLALKVMKSSNQPNRVVSIITDGSFTDLNRSLPIIQQINAQGVDTILMLMGLHMERDRRGCTHVVHVNDLSRAAVELKTTIKRIGENVAQRVAETRGFHLD